MKKIITIGTLLSLILAANYTSAGSEYATPKDKTFNPIAQYNKIEKTKPGLEKYKQEKKQNNKVLINEKAKDILTTVTFNKPMNQKELTSFIGKHKIGKIKQVQGRFIDAKGERITLTSLYSSEEQMQAEIDGIIEKLGDASFVGYTDLVATLDYSNLSTVESEETVFLADTSGDSYFTNEEDKEHPHPLTWDLEDLK